VLANTVSVTRPMTPAVDTTISTTMVAMMPLPGGASGSNAAARAHRQDRDAHPGGGSSAAASYDPGGDARKAKVA
jgi:hypothetical protein